jgi:hypothetical protein
MIKHNLKKLTATIKREWRKYMLKMGLIVSLSIDFLKIHVKVCSDCEFAID